MELRQIPLSQLVRHPRNTRKQQDIAQLAASIRSIGVISNLVGQELPDGKVGVLGGWHRTRAVASIVEAGDSERFHGDPSLDIAVFPAGAKVSASEITAAENFVRTPLHPADEFDSIKQMVDEGLVVDEIAVKLGRDPAHISRLLKLANVAPSLVALFREDKIRLDQLQALALTSDQSLQEKVWKAAKGHLQDPQHLKQAVMRQALDVSRDPVARFIGVDAYKKAGGAVTTDVFNTSAAHGYMDDPALARKVAQAKLDEKVQELLKAGWLWAEARLEFGRGDRGKFGEAKWSYNSRYDKVWAPNAKEYSGVVVTVDGNGKMEVIEGLVRSKDKKKREESDKAAKAKSKASNRDRAAAAAGKAAARKPGKLTFAAVQRLQGERTAVLRAELATKPRLMLAALAADLAKAQFFDSMLRHDDLVVRLSGDRNFSMNQNARGTMQQHPRLKEFDAAGKKWKSELTPHKEDLLSHLLGQAETVTHQLLAYLVAGHIHATQNYESGQDVGRRFLQAVGVDMGKHWKVTAEWVESQPRALVLAAITEALGKTKAAEIDKAKGKEQFVKAALPVLAKAGWLPEPLRAPAAPKKRDAKQRAANDGGGRDE